MFSLTDFLKLLKCRLLLAADMKLNTGKCFLFEKIPVFQKEHISMEAPNSVFTTSVNEDIKNLWTKVQHSVLLFAPLRRLIVQESSSVMSEVAVITCLVACSFLQMRRPWCCFFFRLFLCFSQNVKSATKAICCFYKGKQRSENGCNFFLSKMHYKVPLTFCFLRYSCLLCTLCSHLRSGKQGAKITHRLTRWVIDFSMNHLKSLSLTEHKHGGVDIKNSSLVRLPYIRVQRET